MTDEQANKEHNWITARVMQHMDTAALFAANFNMDVDNYVRLSREAFIHAQTLLNYKPEKYPIATEE